MTRSAKRSWRPRGRLVLGRICQAPPPTPIKGMVLARRRWRGSRKPCQPSNSRPRKGLAEALAAIRRGREARAAAATPSMASRLEERGRRYARGVRVIKAIAGVAGNRVRRPDLRSDRFAGQPPSKEPADKYRRRASAALSAPAFDSSRSGSRKIDEERCSHPPWRPRRRPSALPDTVRWNAATTWKAMQSHSGAAASHRIPRPKWTSQRMSRRRARRERELSRPRTADAPWTTRVRTDRLKWPRRIHPPGGSFRRRAVQPRTEPRRPSHHRRAPKPECQWARRCRNRTPQYSLKHPLLKPVIFASESCAGQCIMSIRGADPAHEQGREDRVCA